MANCCSLKITTLVQWKDGCSPHYFLVTWLTLSFHLWEMGIASGKSQKLIRGHEWVGWTGAKAFTSTTGSTFACVLLTGPPQAPLVPSPLPPKEKQKMRVGWQGDFLVDFTLNLISRQITVAYSLILKRLECCQMSKHKNQKEIKVIFLLVLSPIAKHFCSNNVYTAIVLLCLEK